MICKIVNPKRLNVGDVIGFGRYQLLTINKIEGKKVYLTDSETGEKIENGILSTEFQVLSLYRS